MRGGFLEDVLASRSQFNVLGHGLESRKSSKMSFPLLEDSTIFDLFKMGQGHDRFSFVLKNARELAKKISKTFFILENAKFWSKVLFFFWRTPEFSDKFTNFFLFCFEDDFRVVSLVLGSEHSCPWPRKGLSFVELSLSMASDSFCFLGLVRCVLDSISDHYKVIAFIMLPFRYGSAFTNITLITALRLSMKPMV